MKKKLTTLLVVALAIIMLVPTIASADNLRNELRITILGGGTKEFSSDDEKIQNDYYALYELYSTTIWNETTTPILYYSRVRDASTGDHAGAYISYYGNDIDNQKLLMYYSGYYYSGDDYYLALQCESSDPRTSDMHCTWQPDRQ